LYSQEAYDKWHQYPAPDNGSYAYPWLWVDGVQRGWEYQYWRDYIETELNVPADVGVSLSGSYDPGPRTGQVRMVFANGSSSPVNAVALVAITEDSIYYPATNGDVWHNHVLRDYIPDANGTAVTIPPLGEDTLSQSFLLDPAWSDQRCNVVVYLQNPVVQPDSSKPVFQGGTVTVLQLSGVKEATPVAASSPGLTLFPNPCSGRLQVRPAQAAGPGRHVIQIRDVSGRIVKTAAISQSAFRSSQSIDLRDLPDGSYFVSVSGQLSGSTRFLLTR